MYNGVSLSCECASYKYDINIIYSDKEGKGVSTRLPRHGQRTLCGDDFKELKEEKQR